MDPHFGGDWHHADVSCVATLCFGDPYCLHLEGEVTAQWPLVILTL